MCFDVCAYRLALSRGANPCVFTYVPIGSRVLVSFRTVSVRRVSVRHVSVRRVSARPSSVRFVSVWIRPFSVRPVSELKWILGSSWLNTPYVSTATSCGRAMRPGSSSLRSKSVRSLCGYHGRFVPQCKRARRSSTQQGAFQSSTSRRSTSQHSTAPTIPSALLVLVGLFCRVTCGVLREAFCVALRGVFRGMISGVFCVAVRGVFRGVFRWGVSCGVS